MKFKMAIAASAVGLMAFMACEKEEASLAPINGSGTTVSSNTSSTSTTINVNTGGFIPLSTALTLINHHNNLGCDNYTKANAYGKNKIEDLLNQKGAVGLRAYHATKDVVIDGTLTKTRELVLVAVNASGQDILNANNILILDMSAPCPTVCDTNGSPLLTEPVNTAGSGTIINVNSGTFITAQQATAMRNHYKNTGCNNFTQSNTYGKNNINQLLAQDGAVGLRFYHGSKSEIINEVSQITRELIIVAVDANGYDIIDSTNPLLLDLSNPCPNYCDNSSFLY